MKKEVNRIAEVLENGQPAKSGGMDIVIAPIQTQVIEVPIEGVTPLLVQAWSHKAMQQMLDKQMKKARGAKVAKNPKEDYEASRYKSTSGWDGVPANGIKGCLVNACRAVDGMPMTLAKRILFVQSQGMTKEGKELVRIYGEPEMHQEMVRIDNGGTADIRFRALYRKWSMKLQIEFPANVISAEQVVNLIQLAGFIEGLCEHRPGSPKSNTGTNGRFKIVAEN